MEVYFFHIIYNISLPRINLTIHKSISEMVSLLTKLSLLFNLKRLILIIFSHKISHKIRLLYLFHTQKVNLQPIDQKINDYLIILLFYRLILKIRCREEEVEKNRNKIRLFKHYFKIV